MDKEMLKRWKWVQTYQKTKNAGLTCLRCGISRPTLRKWWRRYQDHGLEGLKSQSRRPHSSIRKVQDLEHGWVMELRRKRKLGARRIANELRRLYDFSISLATIQKVLVKEQCSFLPRRKRSGQKTRRYNRSIPGDRVQVDVMKVRPGLYQYTAIDDCTRYRVLGLYPRRTAENSLDFLEKVLEELPFPVQRIQTDRGLEFFAYSFQEKLMEYHIKFRPIRPGSPYLNGKVERSQRTDKDEFYATVDLYDPELSTKLEEWQDYYNCFRPHLSLGNQSPWQIWLDKAAVTPLSEEIFATYDESRETIRDQDYAWDSRYQKLKR
ncbi:MAG: IS481 family transposase [Sporomusaceae bacterium]|nr:IS481 family transposase [Sporomusaceae bacterium]